MLLLCAGYSKRNCLNSRMLFRDTIPNIIALQFLGVGITILLLVGIILLWRKRNYPNSRVLFKDTTPKIVALQVLGWGITILGMMSITLFWRHSFRLAIFYVALAALLTFILFRRRKIAFAMVALSFLIVNVGLTALFHPTPGGVLITLGSIAAMFVLVVWGARKYPHLRRQDWKTLFDRDPES